MIETLNIIASTISANSPEISAISAAIVAGVAVMALRRFKSQKWWERRLDSYLKVIDALLDARAYYDRELRAEVRQSSIPDEQLKVLLENARSADQEIQKAIDLTELLISKKAHRRLIQYKKDIALAERTFDDDGFMVDWVRHLSACLDATTTCKADMMEITKKDLALP